MASSSSITIMTLSYKIVQMNRELFQDPTQAQCGLLKRFLGKGSSFHKHWVTLWFCEEDFKSYGIKFLCVSFTDFYTDMHLNDLLVVLIKCVKNLLGE